MKITTLIAALLLLIIGFTATGCGVYYYDRDYYPGYHRDYGNHHYDRDHDNEHGRGDRW
jgi:hypothetical protein